MQECIMRYFPERLKKILCRCNAEVNEIRLRAKKPLSVYLNGMIRYPDLCGTLCAVPQKETIVTAEEIAAVFEAVCRYSVHSYKNEISNGFVTVEGGHRVGFCGRAVIRDGEIVSLKSVNAINFRIASQHIGCAEEIFNRVFSCGLKNVLIAGPPCSGKTTVLRDLCRLISERHIVSLIDERSEIAAVYNGSPENEVGTNTDIFDGYTKPIGIEAAVRVMSPQIIFCDEAGSEEDFHAFCHAAESGIYIAASVHAFTVNDIFSRFSGIGMFDYVVLLERCKIKEIVKADEYAETYLLRSNNSHCRDDGKLFCGGNGKAAGAVKNVGNYVCGG